MRFERQRQTRPFDDKLFLADAPSVSTSRTAAEIRSAMPPWRLLVNHTLAPPQAAMAGAVERPPQPIHSGVTDGSIQNVLGRGDGVSDHRGGSFEIGFGDQTAVIQHGQQRRDTAAVQHSAAGELGLMVVSGFALPADSHTTAGEAGDDLR